LGRNGVKFLRDSLPDIERQFACQSLAITVSGISPTGLLRRDLQRYFKADFEIVEMRVRARGIQCAASLKGGWDGYLSRRSSITRRNIRKQLRRAEQAGVAYERHCPIPPEADHLFDRMLALELQSWKGIAEQGMEQPGVVDFYHLMLRELSETADARVFMARFEDRDIGYIFGEFWAGSIAVSNSASSMIGQQALLATRFRLNKSNVSAKRAPIAMT
jgi:hypothetical protein